ncbi:MAG: hypothetical protein LUB59_03735 [Candidatus Gastranaerophilales bacterium]|nr:hypothetical protein [Candidatus Gastranaerophilales bacterium]
MKLYVCRGKRQANYFLDYGCKLIRIDCDKTAKGYLVFIFHWNGALDAALKSWETDKDTYLIS